MPSTNFETTTRTNLGRAAGRHRLPSDVTVSLCGCNPMKDDRSEALLAHDVYVCLERPSGALLPEVMSPSDIHGVISPDLLRSILGAVKHGWGSHNRGLRHSRALLPLSTSCEAVVLTWGN